MEETKKEKNGFQSFLPDDVLFKIFLLFPAETLHRVMRYVCRQWYDVITDSVFVNTHLQQSTTGLFVKNLDYSSELANFTEIGRGVITMKDPTFWDHIHVIGGCDGLILYRESKHILHVVNPLTYERITLPKPPMTIGIDCGSAIARCPSTGRFKVLHKYYDREWVIQCKIITVGVDKEWRPVNNAQDFCIPRRDKLNRENILGIRGFFYQSPDILPYVVTLDLEDETVSQFPGPKELMGTRSCFYRAMGNLLSAMTIWYDDCLNIWAVTDLKKGIWTKLHKINFRTHRCKFAGEISCNETLMVVVDWVDNGNVVIVSFPEESGSKENYITHNIKTGEFTTGTTLQQIKYRFCRAHVTSLVSLKDH